MRRLGLLPWLLACILLGPAATADDAPKAKPPEPAKLVAAWLGAAPAARPALAAKLRAMGAKAVPALKAARAAADEACGGRIDRLLARIRVDHHRAHVPAGMVYVPAGPLEVPRDEAPWGPSGARREVGAFYLGRTEVTIAAWRTWLATLTKDEPEAAKRLGLVVPDRDADGTLPVTGVRHPDAERYARDHAARLPTADEFERAVRGSGVATWPWGDRMRRERANLAGHGPGDLLPVGRHPSGASAFGALDLVGNAAEWSATHVAQGRSGRYPLLLGGSYRDPADPALTWRGLVRGRARTSGRERHPWIGFRLARDVPALPDAAE